MGGFNFESAAELDGMGWADMFRGGTWFLLVLVPRLYPIIQKNKGYWKKTSLELLMISFNQSRPNLWPIFVISFL